VLHWLTAGHAAAPAILVMLIGVPGCSDVTSNPASPTAATNSTGPSSSADTGTVANANGSSGSGSPGGSTPEDGNGNPNGNGHGHDTGDNGTERSSRYMMTPVIGVVSILVGVAHRDGLLARRRARVRRR
jgi:hypothetical protein